MKHFLLLLRFKVGSIILERFIYLFIEIWLKKSSLEIFSNRLIDSRVLIHVDISKLEFSLNYRLYRSRQEENIHVSKRALSTKDSRLQMRKEERRRKREATTKRRIAWRLEKITEARGSRLIRACVKAGKNGSPLLGRMEGWKREEGEGGKNLRNALLRSLLFGCRHPSLRGEKECLRYRGIRDPRRASLQY